MKTRVVFRSSSPVNNEWEEGECGYIDGYLMQNDDRAFAVVIKDDGKIVLAHISVLKALNT